MSIFSLAKQSRLLQNTKGSSVEISAYPGDKGYGKNDLFDNEEYVYGFEDIISMYPQLEKLTIHIPELVVDKMNVAFAQYITYLENIPYIHVNILNQNIRYMQDLEHLSKLYSFADHITQTTAHDKYANQETADKFCLPLKHFSVFIDPSQYEHTPYTLKENIIAYSPDKSIYKNAIIANLQSSLPDYSFIEIKDMSYDHYKSVVAKSKFVLTFGEGLDGYLIESTFSGGIAVSVYNGDFFPDISYANEPFIYKSYEEMTKQLARDIKDVDSQQKYEKTVRSMYKRLSNLYAQKNYIKNIKDFYNNKVDFMPTYKRREFFMHTSVKNLTLELNKVKAAHSQALSRLKVLEQEVRIVKNSRMKYINKLDNMEKSVSWRLTKPFRAIKSLIR